MIFIRLAQGCAKRRDRNETYKCLNSNPEPRPRTPTPNPAPQVLVATPARLRQMLAAGAVVVDRLRTVVLDEADELLSEGFSADVRRAVGAMVGRFGINAQGDPVQARGPPSPTGSH